MVIGGNVIGIIDQFEVEGLVLCEICVDDWCSFIVWFMFQGCCQFKCMVLIYEIWIVEFFVGWILVQKIQVYELFVQFKMYLKDIIL